MPELSQVFSQAIRDLTEKHSRYQAREIEHVSTITQLRQEVASLTERAKEAAEVVSMRESEAIMRAQLQDAEEANGQLVRSLAGFKEQCRELKSTNRILEHANKVLAKQFEAYTAQVTVGEAAVQQVASFVNKVYVATRLYLEKNTHDIEGFQLRKQWQDMQQERENERKTVG